MSRKENTPKYEKDKREPAEDEIRLHQSNFMTQDHVVSWIHKFYSLHYVAIF
jgi:hypothetical protein